MEDGDVPPPIRGESEQVGATIHFGDESGIRRHDLGVARAQTPVVQATGRCFSLNMISAVSTQGEFRLMLHEGTVGSKVFVELLKHLTVNAEKPVFLIVDGHPIHKAKMIKCFVEGLNG